MKLTQINEIIEDDKTICWVYLKPDMDWLVLFEKGISKKDKQEKIKQIRWLAKELEKEVEFAQIQQ